MQACQLVCMPSLLPLRILLNTMCRTVSGVVSTAATQAEADEPAETGLPFSELQSFSQTILESPVCQVFSPTTLHLVYQAAIVAPIGLPNLDPPPYATDLWRQKFPNTSCPLVAGLVQSAADCELSV